MNKIFVSIKNSNLKNINKNESYEIELNRCMGYGTYGFIFLSNKYGYIVKILAEDPKSKIIDDLSDYTEIQVVEKILEKKEIFSINCSDYAYGKIILEESYTTKQCKIPIIMNNSIMIYQNPEKETSPIFSEITKKNKVKRFALYENNDVILMPLYIPFHDYIKVIGKTQFKNEAVVCKIMDCIIKSVLEMKEIGLINLDLKMGNTMIDSNNNMKIIDFGIVKKYKLIEKKYEEDEKYYIWPTNINISYSHVLSYMISVYFIELIFGHKAYDIETDKRAIIESLFELKYISERFKELIRKGLNCVVNFDEFQNYFKEIRKEFFIESINLPNIFSFALQQKGINFYSLIRNY